MSAQLAYDISLSPRVIRLRDAPGYLGMDKNRFNAEVRPLLTEIPIGTQGIGFDRLDLDAWWEDYKQRNGRQRANLKGIETCQNAQPVSRGKGTSGKSTKRSEGTADFVKVLALARSKKQKAT